MSRQCRCGRPARTLILLPEADPMFVCGYHDRAYIVRYPLWASLATILRMQWRAVEDQRMTTKAGERLLKLRGLFGGETDQRAAMWLDEVLAEARADAIAAVRAEVKQLYWAGCDWQPEHERDVTAILDRIAGQPEEQR